MIKFFRNIRQQLLMENKTGKYFKYAIGEIVLVVIGILIALQINNWNIERIQRKNEIMILKDLQVEFLENLSDAERVMEGNENIYLAMTKIQNYSDREEYSYEAMDTLMYYVFDWFDYTPKPGASNNLINSGNLNIISNKELRKLLTLWSGVAAELDDDEQVSVRYSQDIILPFLAGKFPFRNLETYDLRDGYYLKNGDLLKEFRPALKSSYDLPLLLNDKIFQNHISSKKMYARHNAYECVNVVKTCSAILALIDQQLDSSNP